MGRSGWDAEGCSAAGTASGRSSPLALAWVWWLAGRCGLGDARRDLAGAVGEQHRGQLAAELLGPLDRADDRAAQVDGGVEAAGEGPQRELDHAVPAVDDLGEGADRRGAAGLERGEQRPLGGDAGPGVRIVQGRHGGDHVGPVRAALDREGSLPRGGQHLQRVDELAHLVEAPEPGQARTGQDDRVVPAVVDQPQPGVDVAADRLDPQAEAERGELRGAARGAGADDRAGGQLAEGEAVAGDERVAGVLAHRDRGDDQAGLGRDRQVLERVHREVDLAALQGVPDGGGEDAGAADGGQRRGRGVTEGGDLDQLDLVAERPQLVGDPPGLGGREGAAAGAEPDHAGRRSLRGRGAGPAVVGAAVVGAGAHASGPVSGGTDTAATSCGSRSNRSRSAWA